MDGCVLFKSELNDKNWLQMASVPTTFGLMAVILPTMFGYFDFESVLFCLVELPTITMLNFLVFIEAATLHSLSQDEIPRLFVIFFN